MNKLAPETLEAIKVLFPYGQNCPDVFMIYYVNEAEEQICREYFNCHKTANERAYELQHQKDIIDTELYSLAWNIERKFY